MKTTVELSRDAYEALAAHAAETFPHECCGFVVRRDGRQVVVRVTNIQNQKHAEDPAGFPRTAEIAYTMGPEAAPVLIDHERGALTIEAIYHSHPQHDAYFSAEDRAQATVWDEPSYPDAGQIVVSVRDGVVRDVRAFRWSASAGDFVAAELRTGDGGIT
jgi:adenylyltransferase/sulfurtransferase